MKRRWVGDADYPRGPENQLCRAEAAKDPGERLWARRQLLGERAFGRSNLDFDRLVGVRVRATLQQPINEASFNIAELQSFDGCHEHVQMRIHRGKHPPRKVRIFQLMPFEGLGWNDDDFALGYRSGVCWIAQIADER